MEKIEEYYKELACTASYIVWSGVLNCSFFSGFDRSYEIAKAFMEKYPLDTKWGIDEGLMWDETVEKFVKDNYTI